MLISMMFSLALGVTIDGVQDYGIRTGAFSGSMAGTAVGSCPAAGGGVLVDTYGIQTCRPISDVAPQQLRVVSASSYPGAATNVTGADLVMRAGLGRQNFVIADYTACNGSSSATLTINGSATTLTQGVEWTAATSNASTCSSLASAINTALSTYVTATCSTATVQLAYKAATVNHVIVTRVGTSCLTANNGTLGNTQMYGSMYTTSARRYCWSDSVGNTSTIDACLARSGTGAIAAYTTSSGTTAAAFTVGALTSSSVNAGSGTIQTTGNVQAAQFLGAVQLVTGTSIVEPFTCNSSNVGRVVYADDTDDTLGGALCACAATNDNGSGTPGAYDWILVATSTPAVPVACPFF